jgi:hypothetical protein
MADDDYSVGFGRPPRHTRFKPGQSGNPRGRPKGAKNVATALEKELNACVTITESGKRRRVPKRTVIAKHLVNNAAQGDLKAMAVLFNQLRSVETDSALELAEEPSSRMEDRFVIESIRQRIMRAAENDTPSSVPEQPMAPQQDDDAEAP